MMISRLRPACLFRLKCRVSINYEPDLSQNGYGTKWLRNLAKNRTKETDDRTKSVCCHCKRLPSSRTRRACKTRHFWTQSQRPRAVQRNGEFPISVRYLIPRPQTKLNLSFVALYTTSGTNLLVQDDHRSTAIPVHIEKRLAPT